VRAPERRARCGSRRRRRRAHPHGRDRRRELPGRARRRGGLPAGLGRDRQASQLRARVRRCRSRRAARGLDFYRDLAPAADQERAFSAQIELARETGKPLVVHTRAAAEQTLAQLASEAAGIDVVMHCFSMPEQLDECVRRGYAISFAGNVTYPSAGELAGSAAQVPAEALLVETDAPYLTPQELRRERNQPAYVVRTAAFIAALRGVPVEELEATVAANAARVFGWS
jgi:TatD DNase family protein